MQRKLGFIKTALILFCILAACIVYWLTYYGIPGHATIERVNENVVHSLKQQLEVKGLKLGNAIFIRIFKESKELEVWVQKEGKYVLFKNYPICAYSGKLGPKQKEGDRQSPEGFYAVSPSQMNPNSNYHLAFNLGFPNHYDQNHGYTGSFLMVHGNCVSIGCYAMTDQGIEEIYLLADAAHKNKQDAFQVHIFPFRMTEERMRRSKTSPWFFFWTNVKLGYDYFEKNHVPPTVTVKQKQYIIN